MDTALDFVAQVFSTTMQNDVAIIVGFFIMVMFVAEAYKFISASLGD